MRACRKLGVRIRCVGSGHTWAPYFGDEGTMLMYMRDLKREDGDQIILLEVKLCYTVTLEIFPLDFPAKLCSLPNFPLTQSFVTK